MSTQRSVLLDIQELNMTYLLLVQRLAASGNTETEHMLGLSDSVAQAVQSLTLPQLVSLAETNQCILKVRSDAMKMAKLSFSESVMGETKMAEDPFSTGMQKRKTI